MLSDDNVKVPRGLLTLCLGIIMDARADLHPSQSFTEDIALAIAQLRVALASAEPSEPPTPPPTTEEGEWPTDERLREIWDPLRGAPRARREWEAKRGNYNPEYKKFITAEDDALVAIDKIKGGYGVSILEQCFSVVRCNPQLACVSRKTGVRYYFCFWCRETPTSARGQKPKCPLEGIKAKGAQE